MGLMPQYRIDANQQDITDKIADRLVSLTMTDEAGFDSDTLEIVLADHDPAQPIQMPETGAELELFLGYDGQLQRMGMFVVDELELAGWPSTLTIRSKAAPFSKSKGGKTDLQTQKSRSWPKGTKLGAMVNKIAGEHGMQAAVSQSLQNITLPHFDQSEESDISFLVRIARRYDAVAKPAGGKIVVAKLGESKSASGEELPAVKVDASQVSNFTMTLAKRDSPGTVIAYHHVKRTARKIPVQVGSGEPVRRLRHWYQDEDAARQGAQAELDKRARGEHKLMLTMPGDATLAAESPLTVTGFRDGVNGDWLVTRVVHNVTKSGGYACDLEAEKPGKQDDTE